MKMMVITIQQLVKSMEVVQDVLITICMTKDKEEKTKIDQCVQKIKQNKESIVAMYKIQLESYSNQKSNLRKGSLIDDKSKSLYPMDIVGYEDF